MKRTQWQGRSARGEKVKLHQKGKPTLSRAGGDVQSSAVQAREVGHAGATEEPLRLERGALLARVAAGMPTMACDQRGLAGGAEVWLRSRDEGRRMAHL